MENKPVAQNWKLSLVFAGKRLPKVDLLGSIDAYFTVKKLNTEDGSHSDIYSSEYIKRNRNPEWKQFTLTSNELGTDLNQLLQIEVFDWNRKSKDEFIGSLSINVQNLVSSKMGNKRHPIRKGDELEGDLVIKKAELIQEETISTSTAERNERNSSSEQKKEESVGKNPANNFYQELIIAVEEENFVALEKITSNPSFTIDSETIKEINDKIQSKSNKEKYVDIFSTHILNHRIYPDDYTCLLLSEHVSKDLKQGETFQLENTLTGGEWKIHTIFTAKENNTGYYGALFVNDSAKQVVLAHRGISLNFKDALTRGGGVAGVIDSALRQNIGTKLHSQQLLGAQSTASAINLVKEGGLFSGYSLTSTGHSLGGWLAQLSAFYTQSSFLGQEDLPIRAVSFDSPGAKDMMEKMQQRYNPIDLETLDIINYISNPNPINCCNEHAVKPLKIEGVIEFNKLSKILKDKQQMFHSIMSHSLDSIKQAFDPSTGKPKEYSIVHNWPTIKFQGEGGYSTAVNHLPQIPTFDMLCPGSSIAVDLAQKTIKKATSFACEQIGSFAPISLANTMVELFSGQIEIEELTSVFSKLGSDYKEKEDNNFQDKFQLNFVSKYKVIDSNNYKFKLGDHKHDILVSKVLSAAKSLEKENSIIRQTIEKFVQQIEEEDDDSYKFKLLNIYEVREKADYIITIAPEILKNTEITTLGQVEIMIENAMHNIVSKTTLTSYIENGSTDQFTKRQKEWNILKELLVPPKQKKGLAVIHGIPGTGKSTLAVKFGQDTFDIVRQFTQITSKSSLLTKYLNLAKILNVSTDSIPNNQDEWDVLVNKVNSQMKELIDQDGQQILFIIDNVPNNEAYEQIKGYLDNLRHIGISIIITTQSSNIGSDNQRISLEPFDKQEAKHYLINTIENINESNVYDLLEVINEQTHGLPKSLSAVVSYLKNMKGITISEYKELFEEATHDQGYKELGLEPSLSIVLRNIIEEHPPVWEMLQYLPHLVPESIPKVVFKEIFGLKQLLDIQNILFSRSLITLGDEGILSTHQILQKNVQQYVKYLQQNNDTETVIDPKPKLLAILNDKLDFINGDIYKHKNWKQKINEISIYIPHATKLTEEMDLSQDCAKVLTSIGEYHFKILLDYNESKKFFEKSLKIAEQVLGEQHPDTANSYNNIGRVYNNQGNYSKALEYLEKSLKIREQVLGEQHPDTAISYNNIGLVYKNQGNYSKALEYYEKSLKIREQVFGEQHPDTANSYNNIGSVHDGQGNYSKAIEYYEKSLKIQEQVLGEQHPNTAGSYNNIGLVYHNQGNYSKAIEYYEKSLKIQEQVLGEQHPDTANSYNNIGAVHDDQDNHSKALGYYEKSLKIREQVLGEQHPDTARSYNNIGLVYKNQRNYSKALEYYEKSLKIKEQVLGEQHPDTANSYTNIGIVYENQGNYSKALDYEKSLKIKEQVLGEQHPDIASIYNNIGLAHDDQGNFSKALEYYEKSLKIEEQVLGEQHPDTASSYNNIGVVYENQGNYSKALEYYEKNLKIQEQVFGEQHPDTANSYNNIGVVYENQGNYSKALEYYEKSLESKKSIYGHQHNEVKQIAKIIFQINSAMA